MITPDSKDFEELKDEISCLRKGKSSDHSPSTKAGNLDHLRDVLARIEQPHRPHESAWRRHLPKRFRPFFRIEKESSHATAADQDVSGTPSLRAAVQRAFLKRKAHHPKDVACQGEASCDPMQKWIVLVDLSPMRPGGGNGGIKPAVLELLKSLGSQSYPFVFVYLTAASSHGEIRQLARDHDYLICVHEDIPWSEAREPAYSREYFLPNPPEDLPRVLGVDVSYAPFGALFFHSPEVPSISLIVDLLHEDWPFGLAKEEQEWRASYIHSACERATLIQCLSRVGAEKLAKRFGRKRPSVFHTYLPIQKRLSRPHHKPNRPYFFYPANFWPHKNHELLLLAYNLYFRQHHDQAPWGLAFTGHCDERGEALRCFARLLGIEEQVTFHGHVPESDLAALYAGAGCMVFPSLHEGFGIPLLEAWHYGLPTILSDLPSLMEIAGDTGCYVNPRDPNAIARAMTSVAQARGRVDPAIKRASERLVLFDLQSEAADLAARIIALAAAPAPPSASLQDPLLELSTPADPGRWTIRFRMEASTPSRLFSACLGSSPFGSYLADESGIVTFDCRPEGRRLRIFGENARSPGAFPMFSSIHYLDETGKCLLAYQGSQ